jgi:hypothetical protein
MYMAACGHYSANPVNKNNQIYMATFLPSFLLNRLIMLSFLVLKEKSSV